MQRKFLKFQNLRLSYLKWGTANPKKLVIAHANGYAAGMYAYIAEALEHEYQIVALDFAGHGESDSTLDFSSWNFFRDQIFALLDHLAWPSCAAIGHSLGGGSLLRAASVDSKRFEKIIAFDPVVLGYASVLYLNIFGNPMARRAAARRAVFKNKEQAFKIFQRHPSNRNWHPQSVKAYIDFCIRETEAGAVLRCDPQVEARIFSQKDFSHLCRLKHIQSETRLVLPEHSYVCPRGSIRRILKGNSASSVERIADSGHLLPFENHSTTLACVRRLL